MPAFLGFSPRSSAGAGGNGGGQILTHDSDGGGQRQEAPRATAEEATAHKEAGGKAHQLLEQELQATEAAALREMELLEDVILSEGVRRDEVRPGGGRIGGWEGVSGLATPQRSTDTAADPSKAHRGGSMFEGGQDFWGGRFLIAPPQATGGGEQGLGATSFQRKACLQIEKQHSRGRGASSCGADFQGARWFFRKSLSEIGFPLPHKQSPRSPARTELLPPAETMPPPGTVPPRPALPVLQRQAHEAPPPTQVDALLPRSAVEGLGCSTHHNGDQVARAPPEQEVQGLLADRNHPWWRRGSGLRAAATCRGPLALILVWGLQSALHMLRYQPRASLVAARVPGLPGTLVTRWWGCAPRAPCSSAGLPELIMYSRYTGRWKSPARTARLDLRPGKWWEKPLASVQKAEKAPAQMMPWGWEPST